MADNAFDLITYIRNAPAVTIESGILLAQTLASSMPKSMPAHVKKSAQKLERVAGEGEAALLQRQRELVQPPEEGSSRDVDIAADSAWSAMRDMLDALARLPEKYERAKKAKWLLATLFPEGTAFLKLSYGAQAVRMDVILKRIDKENLGKTLDAVLGPELLQEVRAIQPRYEAMVKRRLKEMGPASNLMDHVRAIQRVIVEYATAVASTVDSDDPASVVLAREALRPIENHRDQTASNLKRPDASPADPAPAGDSGTEPGEG